MVCFIHIKFLFPVVNASVRVANYPAVPMNEKQ